MEPTSKPVSPRNDGGKNPAPLPLKPTAERPASAPAPVPPAPRPADFGGNASGRPLTKFKFPAETAEGKEERRKHDTDRKAAARAVADKLVEPPCLPSAGAPGSGPLPPKPVDFVTGAVGASGPTQIAPDPDFIPWDADTLAELTDEIVEGCEEGRCSKFRNLALEYKLNERTADKLSATGKYKPAIKRTLKKTAPRATANLLNRLLPGSGRYSAEGVLAIALVANFVHGRRALSETRRIIEEELAREKSKTPPPVTAPGGVAALTEKSK